MTVKIVGTGTAYIGMGRDGDNMCGDGVRWGCNIPRVNL